MGPPLVTRQVGNLLVVHCIQQALMFNDLEFLRCCFVGVFPCRRLYCECRKKASAAS